MKQIRRILFLAAALSAAAIVSGQTVATKLSPSTLHRIQSHSQTRNSSALVSAYLHTKGSVDETALRELGCEINLHLDGLLTVRMPMETIDQLSRLPFITYIEMGMSVHPMLDKARAASGVDSIHAGEQLTQSYTGSGVVVGVVDGGFDFTHPAFYDAEGKQLRIKRVWIQGKDSDAHPEGFSYGTEYTTQEDILAAATDHTGNSHGTHVAAIAAGAHRVENNPYYGVAPDADIVLVAKGDVVDNHVNISDAVSYIFRYAESVNKPCVVNLSLGTLIGPHDGTSTFDRVADMLQGPGRLIVGSSGNYGADPVHASVTFSGQSEETAKLMTSFKIKPTQNDKGGEIDFWGEEGMTFNARVAVVRESTGEIVDESPLLSFTSGETVSLTHEFSSSSKGKVTLTAEVNPGNGRPHLYLSSALTSLRANYALVVIITSSSAGTIHAWADNIYLNFNSTTLQGWTSGDNHSSIVEIGGTGKRIISVGAYVSRDVYRTEGSSREFDTDETLDSLASFSSVGPTLDGRMKPEVVAPGTYIASAGNSFDAYLSSFHTAQTLPWADKTYTYCYMRGTSMSSPYVAGTVALLLQANPNLTPEDLRNILKNTSVNDRYTSFGCGYGKLNAYAALNEVLDRVSEVSVLQTDEALPCRLISVSSDACKLLFTEPTSMIHLSLIDLQGNTRYSDRLENVHEGDTYVLSLDFLKSGVYLLRIGADTFKLVK